MVSIGECSFTFLAPYYTLISLFSDQAIKITTLDYLKSITVLVRVYAKSRYILNAHD